MQSSYLAWQHSTHFKPDGTMTAECVDCHVPPGFRGFLASKMQAAHDLYYHMTMDTSPEAWAQGREGRLARSRSKITNEMCMRCHDPQTTALDALVVDHAKIDDETHCLECHSNLMGGPQVKNRITEFPVRPGTADGSNAP
jgi:predicted CXXCH cytochrome family protein